MKLAPMAIGAVNDAAAEPSSGEHVVARLKTRIREVRALGFHVRQELLGGHQSSWCEIAGKKILFLDAAQPARDQLVAIDEALAGYRPLGEPAT